MLKSLTIRRTMAVSMLYYWSNQDLNFYKNLSMKFILQTHVQTHYDPPIVLFSTSRKSAFPLLQNLIPVDMKKWGYMRKRE